MKTVRVAQNLGVWMKSGTVWLCGAALCACASSSPDWQNNAFAAIRSATSAYLEGNARIADFEFARAQNEVSRTGRPDRMARLELVKCAVAVASVDVSPCTGYDRWSAEAGPEEQAYAAFLAGDWLAIDRDRLPERYRELVALQPDTVDWVQLQDPLSKLIAAGVLLKRGRLMIGDADMAIQTASFQGWRRPLLGWLRVRQRLAENAQDAEAVVNLQRWIRVVEQGGR